MDIKPDFVQEIKETITMSFSTAKLPEIDILRIIAIMIVVLMVHIPNNYAYNFYVELSAFTVFLFHTLGIYVAMGSFAFISSFGLYFQSSNRNIDTPKKLSAFLKKRFIRIFPLYWITLLIFIIIFDYSDLELVYIIAHFLGLQIILAPIYSSPIWTLWFIGLIVIYYLIFIILSYLGSLKKIIPGSLLILIFFLILRFNFDLVEYRFFLYYPLFIIGITASNIYTSTHCAQIKKILNNKHVLIIPIIISCCLIITRLVYPNLTELYYSTLNSTFGTVYIGVIVDQQITLSEFAGAILFVDLIILVFIGFIISMFYLIFKIISLIYDGEKVVNAVSVVAYSTYCVYLFHRPFLVIFNVLMEEIFNFNMFLKSNFYLVLLSIPILFIIAFFIQKVSDIGVNRIIDKIGTYFLPPTIESSIQTDE